MPSNLSSVKTELDELNENYRKKKKVLSFLEGNETHMPDTHTDTKPDTRECLDVCSLIPDDTGDGHFLLN